MITLIHIMSKQRFGFRKNRRTVDVIFIVQHIKKKAKEHQVPLHFNFVDFKAAFDYIERDIVRYFEVFRGGSQDYVSN